MKSVPVIRMLRPHQWTKNFLVFAPLFFSAHWTVELALTSFYAFLAFTMLASAAYCINDVADLEADRKHPLKRKRPIAAGEVSPATAVVVAFILGGLSLITALLIAKSLFIILLIYLVFELLYTYYIKSVPVLDILLLALLFLLRVLAGVSASEIEPSTWLLTVTWLISLMFATGKRYVEITQQGPQADVTRPVLLQYSAAYLRHLITSIASATLVCYLLWCSEGVEKSRFTALEIFPSSLMVAFGIFRYQLLLFQEQLDEDPTTALLTDTPIVVAGLTFLLYLSMVFYYI